MAVYGSRNPHRFADLLTTDTPPLASDLYGCHKLEAESIVRSSGLEWSILRLSGVITLDLLVDYGDFDSFYFGAVMPVDNRCHTVDCRDVASAFAAAVTTDAVREVFMIGGDDSHKQLQHDVGFRQADAIGLGDLFFAGRPGNPDSDADWYPMDWMDTRRAQQVLSFQHYSSSETYDDIRARMGWKVPLLRKTTPAVAALMRHRGPYYKQPGKYADPWGRIRDRWGDPTPDTAQSSPGRVR
jgi:nucleoside-diphosphate-sugar epimerase